MKKQLDMVELLIARRRGELDADKRDEVDRMLAGNAELRELYGLLDGMDEVKQAEEKDSSARAAQMLAMQLYGDWLHQRQRDAASQPPERADVDQTAARQSFSLNGGQMTVDIIAVSDDARELIGHVHGLSPTPMFIECSVGGRRTTADVDENGLFRFANVTSGTVTLSVTLDDDHQTEVTFKV